MITISKYVDVDIDLSERELLDLLKDNNLTKSKIQGEIYNNMDRKELLAVLKFHFSFLDKVIDEVFKSDSLGHAQALEHKLGV